MTTRPNLRPFTVRVHDGTRGGAVYSMLAPSPHRAERTAASTHKRRTGRSVSMAQVVR